MKYISAAVFAHHAENDITVDKVMELLKSVGGNPEEKEAQDAVKKVTAKPMSELIIEGRSKMCSFTASTQTKPAEAQKVEEPTPAAKVEEDEAIGFDLFD